MDSAGIHVSFWGITVWSASGTFDRILPHLAALAHRFFDSNPHLGIAPPYPYRVLRVRLAAIS